MDEKKQYATEEQLIYAAWLDLGMKIGFILLLASFALYLFGLVTPHVPVSELPRYWGMPVKEYLAAAGVHTGWSWVALVGKGDFMNFVGIALLSAVTVFCYIRILPLLFRNGDIAYGVIAVLEVLVLVLAASGILAAGH
jgi:hypothetical protein